MSRSGRVVEFLNEWREGYRQPHDVGHKSWGADPCAACTAEEYDAHEAFVHAARIYGLIDWPPAAASVRGTTETKGASE